MFWEPLEGCPFVSCLSLGGYIFSTLRNWGETNVTVNLFYNIPFGLFFSKKIKNKIFITFFVLIKNNILLFLFYFIFFFVLNTLFHPVALIVSNSIGVWPKYYFVGIFDSVLVI